MEKFKIWAALAAAGTIAITSGWLGAHALANGNSIEFEGKHGETEVKLTLGQCSYETDKTESNNL